jgi:CBS domain-containing protein
MVRFSLRTITEFKVRRLPVIDGHDLIGMVSQADIATNIDDAQAGALVESISAAPRARSLAVLLRCAPAAGIRR